MSHQATKEKRGQNNVSRQKLRSSCDSCHVAKVRCASTGPKQDCARCLSHGLQCSYSPSLRVAKSAYQSTESSTPTRSRPPSRDADSEPTSKRKASGRSLRATRDSSLSCETSHIVSNGFGVGDSGMDFGTEAVATRLWPTSSISSSAVSALESSDDWLQNLWIDRDPSSLGTTTESFQFDDPALWNGAAFGYPGTQQDVGSNSSQMQDTAPSVFQDMNISDQSPLPGNGVSTEPAGNDDAGSKRRLEPAGESCECYTRLLQALHIPLHMRKAARERGGSSMVAFDVLLATNKRAVGGCMTILDCEDCFGGSTCFLLVFALVNQTLALYHYACERYLVGSIKPDRTGENSLIVPGPLRLNIGAYRLEEEDEILLKKELMLIELRKVESLLSRLRALVGQVEDRLESGTYEGLLASSTRHLQQTVNIIQPQR